MAAIMQVEPVGAVRVATHRRFFGYRSTIEGEMKTLAITLKPILYGWAVCLTDGRELARFRGPGARERALRFLRSAFGPGPGLAGSAA
jgi:hypothetical protein